jgi:hypothetical protein
MIELEYILAGGIVLVWAVPFLADYFANKKERVK